MRYILFLMLTTVFLFVFSCNQSDSGGKNEQIEEKTSTGIDTVIVDSTINELKESAEDIKKETDKVKKEIDDLLQD